MSNLRADHAREHWNSIQQEFLPTMTAEEQAEADRIHDRAIAEVRAEEATAAAAAAARRNSVIPSWWTPGCDIPF